MSWTNCSINVAIPTKHAPRPLAQCHEHIVISMWLYPLSMLLDHFLLHRDQREWVLMGILVLLQSCQPPPLRTLPEITFLITWIHIVHSFNTHIYKYIKGFSKNYKVTTRCMTWAHITWYKEFREKGKEGRGISSTRAWRIRERERERERERGMGGGITSDLIHLNTFFCYHRCLYLKTIIDESPLAIVKQPP